LTFNWNVPQGNDRPCGRGGCACRADDRAGNLGWRARQWWLLCLDRAAELVPHPRGLGCEDWQAALLFETVVLSLHGPDFHRQAFGMGLSAALGSSRMLEALRMMDRLRHHVSREGMRRPWLYSVDYIVAVQRPGRAVNGAVLSELARVLLNPSVQCEFGRVKGALPAVRDAVEETIDPAGWKLFHLASLCPDMLLPSMSQLQGSPKALRDRVAAAVRGLLQGSASVEQAARCIARGADGPLAERVRVAKPLAHAHGC
jgi:hypothetical protein